MDAVPAGAVPGSGDPAAWLRRAITERLGLARKATQDPWEPEGDDPLDDEVYIGGDDDQRSGCRLAICRGPKSHENMLHIAANDPRQVIADCEKDLAILDEHKPVWEDYTDGDGIERMSLECSACEPPGTPDSYPCKTVRLLLGGYRWREGFNESWLAGE